MKKLLFLIFPLIIFGFFFLPKGAEAAVCQSHNVRGYAWSENVGWISFSCANTVYVGSGLDFGVDIDTSAGKFSGYAWSENIGWIDFAPAGSYPSAPNYSACLDFPGNGQTCDGAGNYTVSGWARALSYGGGWDGWIKLKGTNYGVSLDKATGEFSGYAWSDMVIGWISFKGANYGVKSALSLNSPPDKPTKAQDTTWDNCIFAGRSIPTFYWTYSDPDNVPLGADPQTAYILEVDENSSFNSPLLHVGASSTDSTSYTLNVDWLDWNATYFWRVKVEDSHNHWSEWSSSQQFKTPQEAYPYSGFNWDPQEPNQKETVIFTPDDLGLSYLWTVTEGNAVFTDGTDETSEQPHIIFKTVNNKVKLQVTEGSYSCESGEYAVTANLPLPEYKEIPPIIWLKKSLAAAAALF